MGVSLSLLRQKSPLAEPAVQVRFLRSVVDARARTFEEAVRASHVDPLKAVEVQVLQLNLGKVCNQTCAHCHVDAGPDRRESMSRETAVECLRVLESTAIPTLDLTGGAPELNPNFEWLVSEARRIDRHVIDRSNLTILVAAGFERIPGFLADRGVEIVASLPCYLEENCDRQRGEGVFRRSIQALRRLNSLGYGRPDTGLTLSLVYNPIGPVLAPPQADLESVYRAQLRDRYGIEFSRLYTINNMPISRFLDDLVRNGEFDRYMQKLIDAFNPSTVEHVMCRTTISVDWQGFLYDCDFNQMLGLPLAAGMPRHIREFDLSLLSQRPIVTDRHCFGCTAGFGSSCQGSLTG